ncbi:sensor histidine kinase [Rhodococcus sp. NPDC127528]|uniref:sensor histidine kinase n=1 Tax=unclassified Rhodococcus (in: high G+C Gram-positive bacteria) TaxID=192944 RepID=UPI00363CB58E
MTAGAVAVGTRREATDRILRVFARFTSVGYVFYLLLLLPSILGQAELLDWWWTPLAAAAVFGSGLAFGAATIAVDTRALRVAGAVAAVAYLVAIATWPLAWNGPPLMNGQGVWLSTFPGVASLAAVAAWRPAIAFGYMVIACAGAQLMNYVARDPAMTSPLIPDIAFAIMYCTLFVGAAVMALHTGRLLDETTDATHRAAASAAARRARAVERERFDALIHDGVMSTLLSASRLGATASVSRQATITMRQLDALRTGTGLHERFDSAEILTHLRTAATEVDENVVLKVNRRQHSDALTMPAEATRAVGAALAEALRNSIRHAGDDADRAVEVAMTPDLLSVRVSDNGKGFDPRTVPPHRLGVAVSIVGRMRQLPGGSARIDSRPSEGTRVHLTWSGP